MKPLISLQLQQPRRVYWPGETLECRYQIDAITPEEIQSVEASVLWYSEGKGEPDLAVHAFQRRTPTDAADRDLRRLASVETVLPNSPLSYSGVILKIRWCVRVRVFWGKGKEETAELPFQLGDVPTPLSRAEENSASTAGSAPTTNED
jgi:hypothetical protein